MKPFSGDMFSGLIPGINSVNAPEYELSGKIPASLISLLDLSKKFFLSLRAHPWTHSSLAILRRAWSDLGTPIGWRSLGVWGGVVFTIALIVWSHDSSDKKGGRGGVRDNVVAPVVGDSAAAASSGSMYIFRDALFYANGSEIVEESDMMYAEELQIQEALLASLLTSRMRNNVISPAIQRSPSLNGEPSRSFCGICLEDQESRQMFRNESCSHSFCYDCTSKHIAAKIQGNMKTILCPGVDCKAPLDINACRQIIPKDILVRWDESLCKSLIPESQTVYCPYRDCSAMLINDSGEVIEEIECPECHRSICVRCRVPWHSDFSCEEFRRLKRKGKDEVLVRELAKKKSWRRCSKCKMYVEKNEGCLHITCRCGYQFCYRCGSKWHVSHYGCRERSSRLPERVAE